MELISDQSLMGEEERGEKFEKDLPISDGGGGGGVDDLGEIEMQWYSCRSKIEVVEEFSASGQFVAFDLAVRKNLFVDYELRTGP